MGFFDLFRGQWSLRSVARPWGERPSIHAHVKAHTDAASGRLRESGQRLPDEPPDDGTIRWAPGALDGVFGHHTEAGDTRVRVGPIVDALVELLTQATAARLERLYALLTEERLLTVMDQVGDDLRAHPQARPDRIHALGEMLAREAPDRDAVKLGIALLGMVRGKDDRELLVQLGLHEELTLYAVVALINQSDDSEKVLWDLAKRVSGWGRIHAVERLGETRNPEIKAWLLREGFRNDIMDAYLAHTCAIAGELHVALATATPDDALLSGAAGIFVALASGGPAPDLSAYAHADAAIDAWLAHVEKRSPTLETLEALDALATRGEISPALAARIEAQRMSAAALELVHTGLASMDPLSFARADEAARRRAIETFSIHERRLTHGEGEASASMFRMMQEASDATIDRALVAAAKRIDCASIATGPSDAMGMGPAFAQHGLLDLVLQELARFPRRGEQFITAALESPVIRNRNAALRTLAAWGKPAWSPALAAAVEAAAANEPVDDVSTRFARVLAGGPYDDAPRSTTVH